MSKSVSTSELRATWEAAAPGWAKWESNLSEDLVDVTDVLLDTAGIGPGMRVLDLACGAGSQTLQAAERVGQNGSVVATDISGEMLKHVRQNARRYGFKNIETLEIAAEELANFGVQFDASISRMGLMLFPSPQNALMAVQQALKPGARIAALVFTTPQNNPFMAQPMQILLRHAGKPPPAPGQPGIFALGGAGVLENLMSESGLVSIQTATVLAPLRLPSANHAVEMMQQAFGAYRSVVASLSEDAKAEAWAEVKDCLTEFETEHGCVTEREFIVGSGAKKG